MRKILEQAVIERKNKLNEDSIPRLPSRRRINRKELRVYAESIGQKPLFLFPEEGYSDKLFLKKYPKQLPILPPYPQIDKKKS
jgi:hypothetical protein